MGLDPAALGPADALLLGSNWELPVHWCAQDLSQHLKLSFLPRDCMALPLRSCQQNVLDAAVLPRLTHLVNGLTFLHIY